MRVDPGHQRRGFGRAVATDLEARARADGYEQLVLDVSEHNDGARSFYESLGYEYVDTADLDGPNRTFRLCVYRTSTG